MVGVVVVGGGGAGTSSNAPMSHASPCGRVTPRASVAGGGQPVVTTSSAGLVAESAIVGTSVAGAFSVSALSTGSAPVTSLAASKTHEPAVVLNKRLKPPSVIEAAVSHAGPVVFDTIVVPTLVAGAFAPTAIPPPELPSMVDDPIVTVSVLGVPGVWVKTRIPPPPPEVEAAVLPLIVTFERVAFTSPNAIPPPPNPAGSVC